MKAYYLFLISLLSLLGVTANAQPNTIGSGLALKFPGTDGNYVDLGDAYNDLTFPFSFEAWVNVKNYTSTFSAFFSTDNSAKTGYYGFVINATATGQLRIEFGDGLGSGFQDRRGVHTMASIPLNQWVHITVICDSISRIRMYFNGVKQSTGFTDGEGAFTSITHSSGRANIGYWSDIYQNQPVSAMMDEIRLWDIALLPDLQIQKNMCKKVPVTAPGLIGYWKIDESTKSVVVRDASSSGIDGRIKGSVEKVNSGAPIGDDSRYKYLTDWTGATLSLLSSSGDRMTLRNITGDPSGVHLYIVDTVPVNKKGLTTAQSFYYGVFCVEDSSAANYTFTYKYSDDDGLVNSGNEPFVTLFKKTNDSSKTWSDLVAQPDTATNVLYKGMQSTRREYILNISGAPEKLVDQLPEVTISSGDKLNIFPNPANRIINLSVSGIKQQVASVRIMDLSGRIVKQVEKFATDQTESVDLLNLQDGVYIAEVITSAGVLFRKFELQQ